MSDLKKQTEKAAESYRKTIEDRTWTMATHQHAERDFTAGALQGPLLLRALGALKEIANSNGMHISHEKQPRNIAHEALLEIEAARGSGK